jgi:hypothetical protein
MKTYRSTADVRELLLERVDLISTSDPHIRDFLSGRSTKRSHGVVHAWAHDSRDGPGGNRHVTAIKRDVRECGSSSVKVEVIASSTGGVEIVQEVGHISSRSREQDDGLVVVGGEASVGWASKLVYASACSCTTTAVMVFNLPGVLVVFNALVKPRILLPSLSIKGATGVSETLCCV